MAQVSRTAGCDFETADWSQCKSAEALISPAVLTLLSSTGRTLRIRATINRRLYRRDRRLT
jgi:hypothetical protein